MIIFTHVPKTSGTSFRKALVEPNIPPDRIYHYAGLRKFVADRAFGQAFVFGHLPFGLHHLSRGETRYITFIRDPVDRAVSFYHFVKDSDPALYRHPLRDDAEAFSLTEFYELRKYQNWQTRFLAGFRHHRLYPHVASDAFDKAVLRRAEFNLMNRYFCYGVLERFEESLELFQRRFGWRCSVEVNAQKKTAQRPRLADLDDATRAELRRSNWLDCRLYETAVANFDAHHLAD
jgi:hypothetical protein